MNIIRIKRKVEAVEMALDTTKQDKIVKVSLIKQILEDGGAGQDFIKWSNYRGLNIRKAYQVDEEGIKNFLRQNTKSGRDSFHNSEGFLKFPYRASVGISGHSEPKQTLTNRESIKEDEVYIRTVEETPISTPLYSLNSPNRRRSLTEEGFRQETGILGSQPHCKEKHGALSEHYQGMELFHENQPQRNNNPDIYFDMEIPLLELLYPHSKEL